MVKLGKSWYSPVYTINAREVKKIKDQEIFSVEKVDDYFSYKLQGKVISDQEAKIKIGGFIIEIDIPLPGDINIGDYISFICDRLDIY